MDFFDKILNFLGLERKFTPSSDVNWTRIETLVHGPGTPPWGDSRDGDSNSAVFACLMALSMAYPEPPVRVYTRRASPSRSTRKTHLPNHALQAILEKPTPNGEFGMKDLWFWTAWCKHTDGNAYWLKVRSGDARTGNVVQLWPISPTLMRPVTLKDSDDFISHYSMQVKPNEYEKVPVENVIHFRLGRDDNDTRFGLSPLKRLVRQVSTDEEADKFVQALLKNYAIPGVVITPGGDSVIDETAARSIKETYMQKFGGEKRGEPLILSQESNVSQFGFSPEQMNMSVLHRIPEERISAVIGVPAIVAGLGAGLDRATYANFREAREMFTEQKLVPMWGIDADVLNMSLRPDFTSDKNIFVEFDTSDVRALQEDEDKKYARLSVGVTGKWILRNEARAEAGFDPIPEWDEEDMKPPAPPQQFGQPADEEPIQEEDEIEREVSKAFQGVVWVTALDFRSVLERDYRLSDSDRARYLSAIKRCDTMPQLMRLYGDYFTYRAKLEEIAEGENRPPFVKQVPPPQTGNTRMDTELRRYHEEISDLCGRALEGDISEAQFRQRMVELTAAAILAMFLLAGGNPNSENGRAQLAEQQQIARDSARGLADDIYSGRYDGEDEDTAAERQEVLEGRLALWGVTLAGVYALGQLNKPPTVRPDGTEVEARYRWQRGATEKPCADCVGLDGVVLTASEWRSIGIRPQDPGLSCGGWNCLCQFVETDEESVGLENVAV